MNGAGGPIGAVEEQDYERRSRSRRGASEYQWSNGGASGEEEQHHQERRSRSIRRGGAGGSGKEEQEHQEHQQRSIRHTRRGGAGASGAPGEEEPDVRLLLIVAPLCAFRLYQLSELQQVREHRATSAPAAQPRASDSGHSGSQRPPPLELSDRPR